ncbi:uncharacterized protein [Haliotis asinina]|uniref:uncharacterized protein n=1 Tax=Haliotis asinina TaxID=109174 RepID=UPI0035321987
MATEGNVLVRLNILIYMAVLIINSSKGSVCSTPDTEENMVRSMCVNGQLFGKKVYLDTSYFTTNMDTCTCSITATRSGGSVSFSFPVVDKDNCDATISLSAFAFIRNCSSGGSYNGFLNVNTTVDLKLQGLGPVSHCMLVYTEAAEMMLSVYCNAATTVATPTTTEQSSLTTTEQITTTPTVVPPTTYAPTTQGTSAVPVSSPTLQISTTEPLTSQTSAVLTTELPDTTLPVTEDNHLTVCPESSIPVVGMCRSDVQQGTRMYLDSTVFSGRFSRCSCKLSVVSAAGGSVDIYPSTIDQKNCEARISIDLLNYNLDCRSFPNHVQPFLHGTNSLDLDISGQGAARYCLLIETKATEVRLQLECAPGVPDEAPPTTTTSTIKPTTAYVTTSSSPTTISTVSVTSTIVPETSTESITTSPSVTQGNALAVCPQAAIPVIGMCREGIQQGTRMYLDSTLFSGDFSRCSCTLSVVSAAGGSVDIYPETIDHSNCKVSIDIDALKYSLDCHKNDNHAPSFLHSSDSLNVDITGEGAVGYCLLIQTKATEIRLQLQCFPGVPAGSENVTTSTTTYTSKIPYVTTAVTATPTSTSSTTMSTITSTTTSTTTSGITSTTFSTTESPKTTGQPTSATTSRTATVTSAVPSTSPTEITAAPVTATSQTTKTTMTSESNSTDNITVFDDKQAAQKVFPVVEVTSGVSAGAVLLLGIVGILLCNRYQKNHPGDEENERKQPIAGYANLEYASANVAVLNPLYSEDTEQGLSQEPGSLQQEQEQEHNISSSSSERLTSPSVDQAVTEFTDAQQVELTYALVNKTGSGVSNYATAPDTRNIKDSVSGLLRL